MTALKDENRFTERSLGIVAPDSGSVRFAYRPINDGTQEDQWLAQGACRQVSIFETTQLKPLKPEYLFSYRFTSGGVAHDMKIHDWEVQATYHSYRRKYGGNALTMMSAEYGKNIPAQNLHLAMGTMKAHPRQFIIIGLLRTTADLRSLAAQQRLF